MTRMRIRTMLGAKLAAVTAIASIVSGAALADVKPDAGDYTALPPGTDLAVMYAQAIRADDLYANRNKQVSNLGLNLNVGILRYVHFMQLGNFIIDPQIIVPFGNQTVDLAGTKNSGVGDTIVGATLWTIANAKTGENLGFSLFATLPSGNDKNQGFALSNNRYALDLQAGYIRKLADQWTVDLIAETEFYGDDRATGVRTDALLQGYGHLRYHISDATHVALSYRHAWGAQQDLHGTAVTGRKNDDNIMATWASFLSKQWQLQLQYTQDLNVENGPKVHGLLGRLLYAF